MIMMKSTQHVLQCYVLQNKNDGVQGGDNDMVFIPQMSLDVNKDEFPVPLCHCQFPVCPCFFNDYKQVSSQSVKYVGLNLCSPVFFLGSSM